MTTINCFPPNPKCPRCEKEDCPSANDILESCPFDWTLTEKENIAIREKMEADEISLQNKKDIAGVIGTVAFPSASMFYIASNHYGWDVITTLCTFSGTSMISCVIAWSINLYLGWDWKKKLGF